MAGVNKMIDYETQQENLRKHRNSGNASTKSSYGIRSSSDNNYNNDDYDNEPSNIKPVYIADNVISLEQTARASWGYTATMYCTAIRNMFEKQTYQDHIACFVNLTTQEYRLFRAFDLLICFTNFRFNSIKKLQNLINKKGSRKTSNEKRQVEINQNKQWIFNIINEEINNNWQLKDFNFTETETVEIKISKQPVS